MRFDAQSILTDGPDKVVSERLRHSSPMITWSIYQYVVKVQTDAADKVASLISGASS